MTIPGGQAGWLGVEQDGERLRASIMWGAGSVVPVESAVIQEGSLVLTRKHEIEIQDAAGKKSKKTLMETITAKADADLLQLVTVKERANGTKEESRSFSGVRQPAMPAAPDLSKVRYQEAIRLFDGKTLKGWYLTDKGAVNGWSVKEGLLVNNPLQIDGKPHRNYGNLRTEQLFLDFNIIVEFRLPENGNSGLYLRGIYEIQVADSFGRQPSAHGMGGLYSRIKPTSNPAKKAGEWQTLEVTLVDRHVTVVLNGEKIIDNQPVAGCTGGALWSDVSRPGPIYLQGDHTGVDYRSLVLRPVAK